MNRVYLSMIAVMAACLMFLGWHIDQQNKQVGALTEQNKALTEAAARAVERQKADRQVLVARQAKIASQARKLAQAQGALSEALQRNNDWRDTNVPDEVQNALHGPFLGLQAGAGGPSGGPAGVQ